MKTNPELKIEKIINYPKKLSSTEIRERVRQGKSVSQLVPRNVEDYIMKNKLYEK